MSFDFVKTEPGDDPMIVEGYFAATPAAVADNPGRNQPIIAGKATDV